jgi:hypothetical protein
MTIDDIATRIRHVLESFLEQEFGGDAEAQALLDIMVEGLSLPNEIMQSHRSFLTRILMRLDDRDLSPDQAWQEIVARSLSVQVGGSLSADNDNAAVRMFLVR